MRWDISQQEQPEKKIRKKTKKHQTHRGGIKRLSWTQKCECVGARDGTVREVSAASAYFYGALVTHW